MSCVEGSDRRRSTSSPKAPAPPRPLCGARPVRGRWRWRGAGVHGTVGHPVLRAGPRPLSGRTPRLPLAASSIRPPGRSSLVGQPPPLGARRALAAERGAPVCGDRPS